MLTEACVMLGIQTKTVMKNKSINFVTPSNKMIQLHKLYISKNKWGGIYREKYLSHF